jgi:hypothetical protein
MEALGVVIDKIALPFLETLNDTAAIARQLSEYAAEAPKNPHVLEAYAYALARNGDIKAASKQIDNLNKIIDKQIVWQNKIAKRSQALLELLLHNPLAAEEQFNTWQSLSLKDLKLEHVRCN